jgi:hypothetical protein
VTVVESAITAPIADVQVGLGPYRAATNDGGAAVIEAPAGTFDLAVWKSGFAPAQQTVQIAADTSVVIEMIRLPEEVKAWE